MVLDAALGEVVVWYYDVAMATEGELTENELDLSRKEGPECSSVKEVKSWIKASRSGH